MASARAAEGELKAGRRRGPLHGIPVALKDLVDTAGVRTTAGSAQYAGRVPAEDADVVSRLRDAGAIVLGKLNMDEFAYNFTSETSYFGASHNPWDTARSPGGSSGGAAIAVATGMCFAAIGSDTGGSIRLPAALCGITGFKPGYGRVSTRGAVPLAWSLDTLGPMCRSAHDCGLMLAVMAPGAGASAPPLNRVRVGVPRETYYDGLDPEVERAVRAAAEGLGGREVKLPALPRAAGWPDLPADYAAVISAEAYTFHEQMLAAHPERYHAGTRAILQGGATVTAAAYIRARREMERLRAGSGRLFESADVLVTPTAPGPAFELGKPASLVYLRNCAPWNLYGLPAVSVPCGFTRTGLPIGLQITGRAGQDELVLAVAAGYQARTDWHLKHPL